jgi:fido (protein-threonine AMPylation protein)
VNVANLVEKNSQTPLPEILFGSDDPARSNRLMRWQRDGKLRRIAPRLYSSNMVDDPADIVRRNLFMIIGHLFPGAILSHRSALEFKPTAAGHIFLTYGYTKNIDLPGVTLRLMKGPDTMPGDNPFTEGLFVSQKERAFLECLQTSRQSGDASKLPPPEMLEAQLEAIIRVQGVEALNAFRDRAREIAARLKMDNAFRRLNAMIGALLATQPEKFLTTPVGLTRAFGLPYDPDRISMFEKLFIFLQQQIFPSLPDAHADNPGFQDFAFFESYFSNYIEGTEFEVAEARQIIDSGQPMPLRLEDSHDVLGTYAVLSNKADMQRIPAHPAALLELLQQRHAILLRSRFDKQPGMFKTINNRAGETHFVDHQLVKGTLTKGFAFYQALTDPFARAAFMMFLVSEVHPFMDGNGRLARVMMNAELVARNQTRILIPTVYRDDYLGALRKLSRQQDPEPYVRMLNRAHEYSSTIPGPTRETMESKLRWTDAFKEHTEGKLRIVS